jgi:hypothetical protein
MRKILVAAVSLLVMGLLQVIPASGQDLSSEAKTAAHKSWLDSVGPGGTRYWVELDAAHRPHRLYVGEGFFQASYGEKERFVETYSHYLAGHPEKFMLIDIFDVATKKPVGEFGWGGFSLCETNRNHPRC